MAILFTLKGEYIQLDHLLKATGLAHSGGAAHQLVAEGLVQVDGQSESRKRAKLRAGQRVACQGEEVEVVAVAEVLPAPES